MPPYGSVGLLAGSAGMGMANLGLENLGNISNLGAGMAMTGINGANQIAMDSAMLGTEAIAGAGTAAAAGGFWSGLGDFGSGVGDVLGSTGFKNVADLGIKGFGAYNQHKAQRDSSRLANKSFAMQQDAYNRNVEADEKRRALRFG